MSRLSDRGHRGRSMAGIVCAALAAGFVAAAPASAAVTVAFQRTVGGALHAEMYPSGLETAPDNTVVIADTGNNQVAKYSVDGSQLWRVGATGSGTGQFENPRDVGVDLSGSIYVSDTRNSRIVKLSSDGTWLDEFRGVGTDTLSFQLGVSVAGPAGGEKVYVADTGRNKVRVLDTDLNQTAVVAANGACGNITGLRDADADSAGNIYVAGYKTNEIVKFTASGTCLTKWGSTGGGDGQFRTPYGVDLGIDPVTGQELVYVADGLNNRVQVFDKDGSFVAKFGSYATPDVVGTFTTMRRVAVARDGSGDVWAADLWGNRIQRWQRTTTGFDFARTIGAVMPEPTSTAVFHEPRGLAWDSAGRLNVADTVHHQIVKFDASGALVEHCGQRAAEGSQLGQFNWPRGVAIDPVSDDIWVADTKQHKVQAVHQDCATGWSLGSGSASAALDGFNWPYSIAIRASDRTAWIADTQNHRVLSYNVATRNVIAAYGVKGGGNNRLLFPSGVGVDPTTGRVWVADSGNNRVVELLDTGGSNITQGRIFNAGLSLRGPEGVAVDTAGRVLVADTDNNRLVVLSNSGSIEVTEGGLNHPANVAVGPDGLVYVADTYNDRVQVYSVTGPDITAPDGQVGVPTPNQVFTTGTSPVTLSGTASDDRALGAVSVAVKNPAGKYLRANGSWGAGFIWVPATLTSPGGPSSTWSLTLTPPSAGTTGIYSVQLRTDDAAGNTDPTRPFVSFQITDGPVDTTAPDASITSPAAAASVPAGTVVLSGSATDDIGVSAVKVAVKRNNTSPVQWWNGSAWDTTQTWLSATLESPGATSTAWSYSWQAPSGAGSVWATVATADAAGNADASRPSVSFRVTG